jgi:hypothetical protein
MVARVYVTDRRHPVHDGAMEIQRADLEWAAGQGVITPRQAEALWVALEQRAAAAPPVAARPRFDLVHVAYYFGALIVIGAMGWFMNVGWERFGGGGILAISLAYAVAFVLAGRRLWHTEGLTTPGGLLVTMAVAMTPLAVYGLERWLGWWPAADPGTYQGFHQFFKGGWFAMEVATVAAGVVALRSYRFPFLVAAIALPLWYMSMDLAPLVLGPQPSWNARAWVSVAAGLAILVAAAEVDRRTRQDFAFWLYLFGLLAFWGGLTAMESASEVRKLGYLAINLGLMAASLLLARPVFVVFGALGVTGYLGHLAYEVFRDSLLFPFALSFIGIAIIALAVHYHRNRARYEGAVVALVPAWIRRRLPTGRAR